MVTVFADRAARVAVVAAALAVALTGCAEPGAPAALETPIVGAWDPEQYLIDLARQQAESLNIADPPDVDVIRFIMPTEDSLWADCLNEQGYAFGSPPGGGLEWPKEQPPELRDAMTLAVYVCINSYPIDPKYRSPDTLERIKWMYRYKATTMLECFSEQGYPYEGKPPTEQAYIDSGGAWSPYAMMPSSREAYERLSEHCPQDPPEYYEQPFW